jgi:hypothetical protein
MKQIAFANQALKILEPDQSVMLYRELRANLYSTDIYLQLNTENKVMQYFQEINNG